MSGAVFDSELWIAGRHEAINQTRGEAVAAADAIKYLKVLAGGGLEEFATSPADGAPVVDGRGRNGAQGSVGDFEIWKFFDGFFNHLFEAVDFNGRDVFIDSV